MKMSIIRKGVILAACLTAVAAWTVTSKAASQSFKVTLNGAQQVPPVETPAKGSADLTYDPATRVLTWTVTLFRLVRSSKHGPFPRPGRRPQERRAGRSGSASRMQSARSHRSKAWRR